jgi:hypothetical protein
MSYGPLTVKRLITVMLLEFLVIHSAGFMGNLAVSDAPKSRKITSMAGFAVFYLLMALGFVVQMKAWWPFLSFVLLLFSRMLGVLLGRAPDAERKRYVQSCWGFGVAAYLLTTFVTIVMPIPRLGITREVAALQDFGGVSGLWISDPHRPIAMGVLYFTSVGLWTLYAPLYLVRPKRRAA